ncbi:Gfo/Idh/MocA family oxidoreductase [soil metagenome]
MKRYRIAGINFDHFHMGDLLRMVHDHPAATIAGICDEHPERMEDAQRNFSLADDAIFTDHAACLEATKPDLVILCPAAARHAEWVEKVAPAGTAIIMEKPFAASVAEADRMIAAMERAGDHLLAINWPLRWYASHVTARRLIVEGKIGDVLEIHSYGGNRGPLYHGADKIEKQPTAEDKAASWFYMASEGGGSLQDYLGYGTTLGTWLNGGQIPESVTCVTGGSPSLEVDEHSITIARYPGGTLSKFETRWGAFTDPWTHQPQPKCGFVVTGTAGTISSYDGEPTVRLQTDSHPEGESIPADPLEAPHDNPINHVLHCLESGEPLTAPLTPEVSRIGQRIVDTAWRSAALHKTLPLVD